MAMPPGDTSGAFPVISDPRDLDPRSGSPGERLLFNNRGTVIALCLLVTAALGIQAARTEVGVSFDKMIPGGHPWVTNYRRHAEDLREAGNALRIAVETTRGTVYDRAYLETLRALNDEVLMIHGVDRPYMRSLWTPSTRWIAVTEEGLEGGPVIPDDYDGSPASLARVRHNVERSGLVGHLVAADLRSTVVVVPLLERDAATGRPPDYRRLARELEAVRARFDSEAIDVHVTGFAQIMGDLIAGMDQMLMFFSIAPLIALLAIYGYTRSWRSALLVVLCSLTAVVWLLGLMKTLGLELDPYSLLVPFLIFAIGVSHGAQKMNGINQDIARGTHRLVAARYTFRRLFMAGLTALLAAAAGFAALTLVPIGAVRQLAVAATIGVAGLVFTNLMLLPVLLSYVGIGRAAAVRAVAAAAAGAGEREPRLLRPFVRFTRPDWAMAALAAGVALAAGALVVTRHLRIGDLDEGAPELRPDSRYNRDAAFMTAHYAASTDVLVVMVSTPEYRCAAYRTMDATDVLEGRLRELPGVASTSSLATLSRRAAAGLNEGSLKWYDIPRNEASLNTIAAQAPRDFADYQCHLLPVYVYLQDHRAETLARVTDAVTAFAARNDGPEAQFQLAAGNAGFEAATNAVVRQADRTTKLAVYAAVILLCFLSFRSWRAVACATLPLLLTSLLCEALMVFLGIGVKVATLPVIALGVGLGVDYALYVLSVTLARMRQGQPLHEAYRQSLAFTGKVVVLAGVTLSVSVATWAFSDIKFQADMGKLLAFMFGWNILATLVLVPALARFLLRPRPALTRPVPSPTPRLATDAPAPG
jgi:predicted RND superfamily exporter protein